VLDLPAIEASLRAVANTFAHLNLTLQDPREDLDDGWIDRMMAGYAAVDGFVAQKVDLLSFGRLKLILELNALVLCGRDPAIRADAAGHLAATESRFYEKVDGGIRDIFEWHEMHAGEAPWLRAAGVYIRMLSTPELFVEGNHRTGTLLMSYLLAREGRPPVVLTPENAKPLLDQSAQFKRQRKTGVLFGLRMPGMKRRFAAFLEAQANPALLRPGPWHPAWNATGDPP
jgi:hypothetical protein